MTTILTGNTARDGARQQVHRLIALVPDVRLRTLLLSASTSLRLLVLLPLDLAQRLDRSSLLLASLLALLPIIRVRAIVVVRIRVVKHILKRIARASLDSLQSVSVRCNPKTDSPAHRRPPRPSCPSSASPAPFAS